jgi:hypothetical protein
MAAERIGRPQRGGNSASTGEPGGPGKPAAPGRRPARRHRSDEPWDVRIEFVVLDEALAGSPGARASGTW